MSLVALAWSLWSLALVSVICRFVSRRILSGPKFWKDLKSDDYMMILALLLLAGVAYTTNEIAANGSNYVEEGATDNWTEEQYASARWGSKMLVAKEEVMLTCIWLVKFCLLILYGRMTSGLRESLAVKITAGYCLLTYILAQVLYLGAWCRPVSNYWAVPIPPGHDQCKNYHNHLITVTILHVSSDLFTLAIPIPMIIRTRLPLRQKIVLCGVFSLGVLVVLLAILNRVFNFVMPHDLVFLAWYNGEASTAVIIANIPFCWPLVRRVFGVESWGGSSPTDPRKNAGRFGNNLNVPPPTIGSAKQKRNWRKHRGESVLDTVLTERDRTDSEEKIMVKHEVSVYETYDIELGERARAH
ncbi:hypothetical protein B0T16DRAFT_337132 [Cercophora newfieldiana]|uniref:Rhodopsin domain-containing protein n=1 Tax=Cercophora newfieldiana TaxID=92897 RepID=A0AA39XSX8_9PEZI|nr:hypothetical protein B0T16DRAFT_337132 [Cercophora newfieldiana]